MEYKQSVALIPNALNTEAEAIRNRTRCRVCKEKIYTGEDIVEGYEDKVRKELYHLECFEETKGGDKIK